MRVKFNYEVNEIFHEIEIEACKIEEIKSLLGIVMSIINNESMKEVHIDPLEDEGEGAAVDELPTTVKWR